MSPRVAPMLSPPVGFGHVSDSVRVEITSPEGDSDGPPAGIDAYLRLVHLGVTGVAATVWTTRDSVAIVHDRQRLAPRTGLSGWLQRKRIDQLHSSELPEGTLWLAELLDGLESGQQLSLRLGTREAFEPTIEAIRSAPSDLESRAWLRHQDLSILADIRPRTSARLISEQAKAAAHGGLELQAAALEQRDIDGLLLPHREWSGGRTTLLHRFGRLALGRDAVYERELAELTDCGIDGIHSEHVARMMAVIVEYYGTVGGGEPAAG